MTHKLLKTAPTITAWLDSMGVKKYTLVPHPQFGFVVDVAGNVDLRDNTIKKIAVKFNHVKGSFDFSHNYLTSLLGAPQIVELGFYCEYNKLTSLEHSPQIVGCAFDCYNNNFTSLRGCPEHVGDWFDCENNNLTSLEHAPKSVGRLFLSDNFTDDDYKAYNEARKEKELFESMQLTLTSTQKRSNKI